MANIRDVARLAQVSPATVSRILNGNQVYKTTDETRKKVLRAAAWTYVVSALASLANLLRLMSISQRRRR